MNQRLTDAAIEERRTWQYRAIAFTHGNQSIVGAIVIAMLGRQVNPPCFHVGGMKITVDGRCLALFKSGRGEQWRVECVYHDVGVMVSEFRGLAEVLALDEAQREAMFSELRKFVFQDDRAVSYLPGITNEDGSKI